jgi:hypothetical protein
MKKRDNSHVTMQLKIQMLMDNNLSRFDFNPAFAEARTKYYKAIATIRKLAQKQDELKRTSNLAKVEARQAAVEFVYRLSALLDSFAYDTHNLVLHDKVSVTYSEIRKLRVNSFFAQSGVILTCCETYLPRLVNYGITAQTIIDGNALLAVLDVEIKKQDQRKIELKSITSQLNKQVKTADKLIEPFDAIVETQRISDPVWYSTWHSARAIKHAAPCRLSAIGKVFDAVTRKPLPGSVLSVSQLDATGAISAAAPLIVKIKTRSFSGGFKLKSLATGTYLITVSYAGYAVQSFTIHINKGVLSRIELPLTALV